MSTIDENEVYESSGNVFADLNLPDAEGLKLKSDLVIQIRREIEARKLTQTAAAKLMGIGQADLSKLLRGNLRGYTAERLMGFMTAFDQDVEVIMRLRPKTGDGGKITFTLATA